MVSTRFHLSSFSLLVGRSFFVLRAGSQFNSALFARLEDPDTTNQATQEIIQTASTDSAAHQYFAERLPALIDSQQPSVRNNAVKLAGRLKAANAVAALARALSHSQYVGFESFAFAWSIDRGPVGKALHEIGDPAVPPFGSMIARPLKP